MKSISVSNFGFAAALWCTAAAAAQASVPVTPGPQLFCHRTANKDVPENTLASLEQAALLGCNVVEIDLRRTLDGRIVLNHDGVLDRLTDGTGDVETSYYGDLALRDAGSWMGNRFNGMHIALFEDALRLARTMHIRLILDMKDKGMAPEVLAMLTREGMLEQVQFNGEWADMKAIYPAATDMSVGMRWVRAGVTAEQVQAFHREGLAVVGNFSDTVQEMDLPAMKAAVAAGVDALNVDYPRLGAEAVGRPVERTLHALRIQAESGESTARCSAILQMSRYEGFPLGNDFARWLLDTDDHVSRAAALALVTAQPKSNVEVFTSALHADNADARANAAWALGQLGAPAAVLLPLLADGNAIVLQAALFALARMPGNMPAPILLTLLGNPQAAVREAAALALAKHQPSVAVAAINAQLRREVDSLQDLYHDYAQRKPQTITPAEINTVTAEYRCQMKMVEALSQIGGSDALRALEEQAFRPGEDFSQMNAIVAGFALWGRIGTDPGAAVAALGSADMGVANRAEWMLAQGGAAVLPQVRAALKSSNAQVRERAIRIVGYQGDQDSLPQLREMSGPDTAEAQAAVGRIEALH